MPRTQDFLDEPTMSDTTILVTVEDLINRAMGPTDANVVNFKLIQTILHILARQQRMLQQRVEIRIIEIRKESKRKKHGDESTEEKSSTESPTPGIVTAHKSPQRGGKKDKPSTLDIKDKVQQKDKADRKEHERDEKVKSKEKREMSAYKTRQMQMMVNKIEEEEEEVIIKEMKGQGRLKKMPQKDTEKTSQQESDKISQKGSEKWETEEKIDQKEPDKISRKRKERLEKEEQIIRKESEKEKEGWATEGKLGQREPEKNLLKEKVRWEEEDKIGQKELDKIARKEKEMWEREEKLGQTELEEIPQKEREREEIIEQKEIDKMSQKEIERWEKEDKTKKMEFDKISQKESQIQEKKENIEKKEREREFEQKKLDTTSQVEKGRWKREDKVERIESAKISQKEMERQETEDKKGLKSEKITVKERESLEEETKTGQLKPNELSHKGSEKREQEEQIQKRKLGKVDKIDVQKEYEIKQKKERLEKDKIEEGEDYEMADKRSQKEREEWDKEKVGQRESDTNTNTESEREGQRKPDKMSQKERERWGKEGKQREKEKNRLAELDKMEERKYYEKLHRREQLIEEEITEIKKYEKTPQEGKERLEKGKIEEREDYEKSDIITQNVKERWEKGEQIERKEPHLISQKERKIEPEQMTQKEMERWDRQKKTTLAERDLLEKVEPKKAEKITQKEKDRLGREEIKEERSRLHKQKTEKERPAREPDLDRMKPAQRSNIEITEKIIDNEKILVVGKRPPTCQDTYSSSSIDVVTRSQFDLLEDAVKQLRRVITPQPLQLPDNKQLMSDVMKGTATLPDAMQTLQIDAKLRAAEDAVVRMAGLLTQLAAAGELPEELLEQLEALEPAYSGLQAQADRSRPLVGKKSVAIDPRAARSKASRVMETEPHTAEQGTPDLSLASRPSAMSRASRIFTISATERVPCVTHEELQAVLRDLRDDILKALNNMTVRASTSAENALHFAKGVADKLDVALQLDERISTLYSVVGDYTEQLNGFDSGLTTQMQSFQDQMAHIRADLRAGLVQLENVNNNAETAAVLELTERCDELAAELDSTLHAHKALAALQAQLGRDMRDLVECMEMLREQKADRDEVLDGLRDKADTSRLAGLLSEVDFAEARTDFERRIDLCHEKFTRQDEVWQTAIRELKATTDKKAELVELLSARDVAQRHLQELNDKIRLLAAALGEPKTALLTRKLSDGATCGACHVRALMEPYEAMHGAPRALPALRPTPVGASQEPCIADLVTGNPSEDRHICLRWCGGSHTLVTEFTKRTQAPPGQLAGLARKFQDYGDDGRLYMMEEECQPCVECNLLNEEEALEVLHGHHGAGDMSPGRESPLECTCPQTD